MPELRDLDPIAVARLVVAVGAYRTTHDTGPTWRQAREAAGWPWHGNKHFLDRMHALRRAGLIVFSRDTRSLDVTPAGRRWALAVLAPARAARRKELA
jgi:hypothetical protein